MKKFISLILTTIALLIFFVPAAQAQSAIEARLKKLEKCKDVEVIVTERRNPATGKVYKISRLIIFTNSSYGNEILKAVETSRPKATLYNYHSKGSLVISINFDSKKEQRKYSIIREGKRWTVTSTEVFYSNYPKHESYQNNRDSFPTAFSFDPGPGCFNDAIIFDGDLNVYIPEEYEINYSISSSSSSSSSQSRK